MQDNVLVPDLKLLISLLTISLIPGLALIISTSLNSQIRVNEEFLIYASCGFLAVSSFFLYITSHLIAKHNEKNAVVMSAGEVDSISDELPTAQQGQLVRCFACRCEFFSLAARAMMRGEATVDTLKCLKCDVVLAGLV